MDLSVSILLLGLISFFIYSIYQSMGLFFSKVLYISSLLKNSSLSFPQIFTFLHLFGFGFCFCFFLGLLILKGHHRDLRCRSTSLFLHGWPVSCAFLKQKERAFEISPSFRYQPFNNPSPCSVCQVRESG